MHINAQSDHRDYFNAVEALMRSHGGRPHWGKLHSRTAEDLEQAYPRWQDFQVMRDRLDPGRVFTNPYLDRVLGEWWSRTARLDTGQTLAGPLGSGACQPRHSASIRKPKQIATPGSATTHSG